VKNTKDGWVWASPILVLATPEELPILETLGMGVSFTEQILRTVCSTHCETPSLFETAAPFPSEHVWGVQRE
jgi:hypothetical protein